MYLAWKYFFSPTTYPVSKNYRPENGILFFSFPFYILYYESALRRRVASFFLAWGEEMLWNVSKRKPVRENTLIKAWYWNCSLRALGCWWQIEKIFWVLRYRLSIFCISLIEPVNIVAGDSFPVVSIWIARGGQNAHHLSLSPWPHFSR